MADEYNIDELLQKDRSELTDGEFEAIVEWKASIKVRDEAYQHTLESIDQAMQDMAETHRNAYEQASRYVDQISEYAYQRLMRASVDEQEA